MSSGLISLIKIIFMVLFIEHKSMLRESLLELVNLFPVMATLNILIIMRENTTR